MLIEHVEKFTDFIGVPKWNALSKEYQTG